MVTSTNGTLLLRGRSGRTYGLNIYISDIINANITISLNSVAGASSQTFYNLPEDCVIQDLSIVTGPTVMTNIAFQINDINIGVISPISTCLTTLNQRAVPKVLLQANKKLTMVQL
jgi:hypothetical protein